ncbi:ATP synthase F0 subunit B [Nocardioides sp. C4-1]|uniref:ATP synthase F0 subunit B n=1 Tax=Nocardioides sp. C4-1 TaxID=3151851 RepID=UPI00326356FC
MPDTPPHLRSDAVVGASVLHEALVMRREVEIELAEAGEIRAAAVAEATSLIETARLAAAGVEEQAEAEARAMVEQAREQAIGIVTQARVEAENLLAEAHADAAQYDAWARQEARERLTGDLAGLTQAIAERRDDLATSIPALEAAIERALVSLDDASWLGVSLVDQVSLPDDAPSHEVTEASRPDAPRRRPEVSLRAVDDLVESDVDVDDGADHEPPLEDADVVRTDEPVEPVEPVEPEQWASVRLVSSSGQRRSMLDDVEPETVGHDAETYPAVEMTAAEVVEMAEVSDDRRRGADDHGDHDDHDDEARPLGWLFRSTPTR